MNRWTNEERILLKQAVETGRSQGKNNQEIAEILERDGQMPRHTAKGITIKMSYLAPKYRKRKNKITRYTGYNKYNRLSQLSAKRVELLTQAEKLSMSIKNVEQQIDALLKQ